MEAMQFPSFSPGFHPKVANPEALDETSRRLATGPFRRVLDGVLKSTFQGPGVSLATGLVLSGVVSAGLWAGLGWAVWSLAS